MSEKTADDAIALARECHKGQVDKANKPYFGHAMRVTDHFKDDLHRQVAALHDILEDTDLTPGDLLSDGYSAEVVDQVTLLSRNYANGDKAYYEAIKSNPIALAVKLADIDDNTDPVRLAELDKIDRALADRLREKYRIALKRLRVTPPQDRREGRAG